jgi:hypothetical protein
MSRKSFRNAFLIGGIFLLSTFMLVQQSWGCDDDDKWDCDHHDEACHPPKIHIVYLTYSADSIGFTIYGKNFRKGAPPVVTLGDMYELEVSDSDYSDTRIIATLPFGNLEGPFVYGDYRLVVSTCQSSACEDRYCKDHGPNCKCNYCKKHCSKCKNKHCKDREYSCKCKDRYSLTIANPSGPKGTIALKIESKTVELSRKEITDIIQVNVECGSGFGVTGGGFSCPKCLESPESLSIMVSEPLQDDKKNGIGWRVTATYLMVPLQTELTVHAICAPVQ